VPKTGRPASWDDRPVTKTDRPASWDGHALAWDGRVLPETGRPAARDGQVPARAGRDLQKDGQFGAMRAGRVTPSAVGLAWLAVRLEPLVVWKTVVASPAQVQSALAARSRRMCAPSKQILSTAT